jgi:hypothetical protein
MSDGVGGGSREVPPYADAGGSLLGLLPNGLKQVLTIRVVLCAWLNGGGQGEQDFAQFGTG